MTETLQRPSPSPSAPRRPGGVSRPRPWQSGVLSALQVAALGLLVVTLPVLFVWASDARAGASAADALRTAGQLWLVAQGASLEIPDGRWTLTPLGLVVLSGLLHAWAARRRCRERPLTSLREAGRLAGSTAFTYAGLAAAVAAVSGTGDVRPGVLSSAVGAFLVAVLGALSGGLRGDRLWRAAWLRLPEWARRHLRHLAVVSGILTAGGALLTGLSLAGHGGTVRDLAAGTDPGPVGGLALLAVGLGLVPNAIVWAVAWLSGSGFAVGVGTLVGPFGYELGPVPAVPLLAALPGSPVPGWWGLAALAVPVAAGLVAGRLVQRDHRGLAAWRVSAQAALVGPVAGLVWALLAWHSGGSAGGARLAEVGPAAWVVGLAVASEVGIAAAVSAGLLARSSQRRGSPEE